MSTGNKKPAPHDKGGVKKATKEEATLRPAALGVDGGTRLERLESLLSVFEAWGRGLKGGRR